MSSYSGVMVLGHDLASELWTSWNIDLLLHGDLRGPTTELLSPMMVMSEGLGFNLCVAPFLNVCVLNLSWRVGAEDVGGGQSWVGGVVLELDGRGLRLDCSEDKS